jgi:hypothetical protein
MFCGECGTQNPDTNQFCKNCGKPLRRNQQVPTQQPAAVSVQPVAAQYQAQPSYYPAQPAASQPYGVPPATTAGTAQAPPGNKGMLVVGILSIGAGIAGFFFYPYVLGILAIVLGAVSVAGTRKKTGKIAFTAILGILIGLAAIFVNHFYFVLFPPKEITLDLLAILL